jgi:Fe-S-cluster containining protein
VSDLPPLVCAGCTLCCRGRQAVVIVPGVDRDDYDIQTVNGYALLAHRPNGDCVYLGPGGCTIYERRPAVCRMFDCRELARKAPMKSWKLIIKKDPHVANMDVVRQGKRLLNRIKLPVPTIPP